MSEPMPPQGLFSRAEAGARGVIIVVGAGVMAWVLGGVVASGLAVRLTERLGSVEDPTWAFVLAWALQRVWLWAVLPGLGWVAGRVLGVTPLTFAVVGALTGEGFGVLLTTAASGLDGLFLGWLDLVVRLATFVVGVWLTWWAVQVGLAEARVAQGVAAELTRAQREEYAAMLERAGAAPPATPPGGPSSPA